MSAWMFPPLLFLGEFQISPGSVEQLHGGNRVEVQPQATEVSQSGPQRPPAFHQRGNTGSNAREQRHLLGLPGRGADFTLKENNRSRV